MGGRAFPDCAAEARDKGAEGRKVGIGSPMWLEALRPASEISSCLPCRRWGDR